MRWLLCLTICVGACDGKETIACDSTGAAAGAVCPRRVSGKVVDETGAPLAAATVSVCADQCYFGTTSASGDFAVVPPYAIVLASYALEVHGRPDRATYYTPLPVATGDDEHPTLDFEGPLPLFLLPTSGPEIRDDQSAQTVTSGDVTLQIPSETDIFFSVEDFGVPHGHDLRTLQISDPSSLPFVASTDPPLQLYALAPFEVAFGKPVAVSLTNRTSLGPNVAVELESQRGLVNGAPPAGRWQHAAHAHVTADGQRIETDAGEGLAELTWLAVREVK
jgi:hypothetical protein